MKAILSIMCCIAVLCLAACQNCGSVERVSVQSDNSSNAQLDVMIEKDEMTVTLTNLTDKTAVVDGEMEFFFDFDFDSQGRNELCAGKEKTLAERVVKLAPGQSLTKVFKSGDVHHYYSVHHGISVDGTGLNMKYRKPYRIPDFSKLDGIVIKYASGGQDSMVPLLLSTKEDTELLNSLLRAVVCVEIKFSDKYERTRAPMFYRGDRELESFNKN